MSKILAQGRTAIWNDELPDVAHQNHAFKAIIFLKEQSDVWLEYLNTPFARDYFAGSNKQTTNLVSINKTQLRGRLIAIPPTDEKQHRRQSRSTDDPMQPAQSLPETRPVNPTTSDRCDG
ncbi:hypothetical protein [Zhongshania arctica]|uniref:Uncharacterized protein n=1 Tax=Zhongshania arctica TaxID=3238302 RepID=A0ABV3TR19_9GAMM